MSLPSPWGPPGYRMTGGLTDIGFSRCGRFLLAASWNGRGVFSVPDMELVARDPRQIPERDRDDDAHTILGIGPLEREPVSVCGLWGGELARFTIDGWSVEARGARIEVVGPGSRTMLPDPVTELRACGFDPAGRILIYATSSDFTSWSRA